MLRVLVLLLVILTSAAAFGQEGRESAKKHRKAAQAAFEMSDYARAIEEFKKAYALDPDPRIFYNLGLSHMKRFELNSAREDFVLARDYFRRFLTLASSETVKAAERRRLERFKRSAEEYLSMLALAEEPRVPPVQSSTAAAVAGAEPGGPKEKPPELRPEPPPVSTPMTTPPLSPPVEEGNSTIFFVVGGATTVAALVTAILAVQSSASAHKAVAADDYARAGTHSDRARVLAVSTDVLAVAAVISVTLGFFID